MRHDLPEHGASASHVVGGNHDLPARERGVGEVDVDVSLGKLAGQLAQGCRPVLHVDHEDLPLVGDPHSSALKGRPAPGHGLAVEEHVHHTPALTGEGRKAMDRNPRFAGNLRQPGQLARPVLKNHCQVRGHRIFDPSTASGATAIQSYRPAQRHARGLFPGTVRPGGRPHAHARIGAGWHDGDLYFTSGPGARTARNLAPDPSLHDLSQASRHDLTPSGEAARVTEPAILQQVASLYRGIGWSAEAAGNGFTMPYSAPSAGPP